MKYAVAGKEKVCWREYGEFVILAAALRKRFKSVVVPPLPVAFSSFGCVSEEQHVARVRELYLFIQSVVRHPFMRNDPLTQAFFESEKTINQKFTDTLLLDESKAQAMWNKFLALIPVPEDPAALLTVVQEEFAALTKAYTHLLREVDGLEPKVERYASTLNEFNVSLDFWRDTERTKLHRVSAMARAPADKSEDIMVASLLEVFQEDIDARRTRVTQRTKHTLDIMKVPIQYELMFFKSFQTCLQQTGESMKAFDQALKAFNDAEKAKAKCTEVQVKAYEKKVNTAKAKLDELRKVRDIHLRGFLVAELERYRYERGARNVKLLHKLAKVHLDAAEIETKQWKDFETIVPPATSGALAELEVLKLATLDEESAKDEKHPVQA